MKLVGKPDAGNRHVRFDERGQETECCHMAQATAPVLDSTASDGEINGGRLYSFGLAFGAACHVSPWSAAALFKSARSSANNREEARPSL